MPRPSSDFFAGMYLLRSLASYYRRTLLRLPAGHGAPATNVHFHNPLAVMDRARWYSSAQGTGFKQNLNRGSTIDGLSSTPPAPRWQFPKWARWAFGSVIALILPFWSQQWRAFRKIEYEVKVAGEVVEEAADVVEKVAILAEKASSEVAEELPKDGKLKDAVLLVERVSTEVAAEAHLAKDIIHKVDELKEEVETLFDPTRIPEKHTPDGAMGST